MIIKKNQELRVRKLVFNSLNKIYKVSKSVANHWALNIVPFFVFKEIIEKAKLNTNTDIKDIKDFDKKYNDVLDCLFDSLKKISDMLGINGISLIELEKAIDVVKCNFDKGLKNE